MKLLLILVLIPVYSLALTPDELRQTVIQNFPLIEEARFKKDAAEAGEMSAEGAFDHKLKFKSRNRIEDKYDNQYFETTIERDTGIRGVSLLAGHRQGSGLFPQYDGKYDTSAAGEIFAGISVPILRDSATDEGRTNLSIARLEKEQASEEVRLKQNMYVHKALSLYFKWISESRILRINNEVLELALKREGMLIKKFQRGDIEKVKLTDNERSMEKRRAEIQKSEIKLKRIEAELNLYTDNLSSLRTVSEKEPNTINSPAFPPVLMTDNLPPLRILAIEKEKGKIVEKLFDQRKLPGLAVDVLGARELSGNVPYDPDRLQVGVRFDFPLENRKARGKTVEQSYKLRALEKRILYVERELKLNYENTLSIIEISKQRFTTTSLEAEKTRIMVRAEEERFRMGGSDLFVMNLRELDVTDAEIRKWTSWYEFHQAVLDAKLYQGSI